MNLTVKRRIKFCAGHRLLGHDGKCANLHGHNYVAEFHVVARMDAIGRLVDFGDLKRELKGWIDEHWDHAFLLWDQDDNAIAALRSVEPTKYYLMPYNPTAENLARHLLTEVCPRLLRPLGAVAVRVAVWETEDSCAEASLPQGCEDAELTAAEIAVSGDATPIS
jgi:6-pyruvoyltetrahydropterin/6-carboxytetrahydropterin synthase